MSSCDFDSWGHSIRQEQFTLCLSFDSGLCFLHESLIKYLIKKTKQQHEFVKFMFLDVNKLRCFFLFLKNIRKGKSRFGTLNWNPLFNARCLIVFANGIIHESLWYGNLGWRSNNANWTIKKLLLMPIGPREKF